MIKRSQDIMSNIKKDRNSSTVYRGFGKPAKVYYNEMLARKAMIEKYGDGLFCSGTNIYVSGTPLYMEAFAMDGGLPFGDKTPRTSDYILCARNEEYQIRGDEIRIDDETINKLTDSVKDIVSDKEMRDFRDIFSKLLDKDTSEEARKELWKIVDADRERFAELEKALMNADVRRSRSILINTLGEGGVDIENIKQSLMEVNKQISDLDIRSDLKNEMLKELDDIYVYCRRKADPVNQIVSINDWNEKYKEIDARELGAERLRFDELIRRETEKAFSKNMNQPEIILIAREDLEDHIEQCMKNAPERLQSFFKDFYDKLRYCLESTDREISLDTLDNDDSNRVPFILHSAVFSNQAADSYEATFTVSDGKNCWCESARMNKDGDVSITSANINAQGIVDDLNVERREDIENERIEIQDDKQAEMKHENSSKEFSAQEKAASEQKNPQVFAGIFGPEM